MRSRSIWCTLWVWGLVLALGACGNSSGSALGNQPSWRKPAEVKGTAVTSAPAVREPIVFAPQAAATLGYNDPPIAPAPSEPLGDAIVAAIARISEARGLPAPAADGRLYAAVAELASVVPENGPLPYPLVEFAMQRQGIIEPSPHLLVMWGPLDDPSAIMEQLTERLPEILGAGTFARVGIGTARRPGRSDGVAILALQSSFLATRPIPKVVRADGIIRLEGRLLEPYADPEVYVTREDGSVIQPPVIRGEGSAFRAEVSCAGRTGAQQVEITGLDASGSTVLANFPVWCNAVPPTSLTVAPTEDDYAPVTSASAAEERMLELVNRDPAASGLPALALDARVAGVARAHSIEMATTGVVAHVSPTTGSAADRVKAAGIRTALILENVARAYGVAEAQSGLMNSPGHRANVMSAQATHLGVGIVLGDEVAGRREMFVTQVFTRVPPRLAPAQAKREVRAAIGEAVPYASSDERLDELAQSFADSLGAGLTPQQAADRIRERLTGLSGFRQLSTVVTTVADIATFDPKTALTEPAMSRYGLGVAQGDHETMGEGAIYIVLLVGQPN